MRIYILLMFLLLGGCAGVGFVTTSDPYEKLQQATELMSQDRALLAEDEIRQALGIFKERNDKLGMAEAYHAFGNLYMSDTYHGKNANTFKSLGTYDGSYTNAIDNFEKASKLFSESNSEVGVIKSMVGIANAHILRDERIKACDYYIDALNRYESGKKSGSITSEPQIYDKRFSNMGQIINSYITGYKCRT